MTPSRAWISRAGVGAIAALSVAGCGASVLSPGQLRSAAAPICRLATNRRNAIAAPTSPAGGEQFLDGGIAAVDAELAKLKTLNGGSAYHHAVDGTDAELAELRSALKGLRDGNDPVIAIKILQDRLAQLEVRTDEEWRALGIPACVSR